MAPYFVLLLIPSVFSLLNPTRVRPILFYGVAVVFVLFVGLRFRVGTDWINYIYIHQRVGSYPLSDVFTESEPLSYALFWVSSRLYDSTFLTNIVAAIVTLFGIFYFAKRTSYPWISLVSATPYLIIVFSMSGIRQAMAVGVMMFGLAYWNQRGRVSQGLFVVLASLFHTSALINFVLNISTTRLPFLIKFLLVVSFAGLGSLVSSNLLFYSDSIDFYQDAYITSEQSIISPGALIHVALIWVPAAIYLLQRRRISRFVLDDRLMFFGAWATIFLLLVYFLSSTVASRITLYLYFVPMMFYPAFLASLSPQKRGVVTLCIVLVHFGILAIWLLYANNAAPHIPYRNVLFENQELYY